MISGDEMKTFAVGVITVDEYGCLESVLEKTDDYKLQFSKYTSGLIKYTNLPKGTKVRVTLEVLEDGDSSQ